MNRKGKEVIETKTEDLLVVLEEDEINARARKLAAKQGELEHQIDEGRRIQGEQATRRKAIEAEIKGLGDAVREGTELRPVAVEVVANYTKATIQEIRQDTFKVLIERAMRADERQIGIPMNEIKNESPRSVAKRLFADGVRPEDVGIEGVVQAAAEMAHVEIAAVLEALVDLAEETAARKGKRKGGDGEASP
jgi:hypothetical protein